MADPKNRDTQRAIRRLVGNIAMAVMLGLVLLFAERVLELHLKGLRGIPAELVRAAIIVAAGAFVAHLLERYAARVMREGGMAARQFTMFRYLGRFVLYLIIVLAVLAAFGVGISSVVFGGAFLTVIVGLAGQTVFGNLLAGLTLVLFHPFSIGDRITFMTWQYPLLMPSYPHEPLMPAYVGTVTDVNMLYTYLQLESGLPMAIPNGIVLQAAVQNHAHATSRTVRARFDVDIALSPERLLSEVRSALDRVPALLKRPAPEVRLIDISPTTFTVLLRVAVPAFMSDDEAREHGLSAALGVVRSLRGELANGSVGGGVPAGGTGGTTAAPGIPGAGGIGRETAGGPVGLAVPQGPSETPETAPEADGSATGEVVPGGQEV